MTGKRVRVAGANNNGTTLKVIIPHLYAQQLKITVGSYCEWELVSTINGEDLHLKKIDEEPGSPV